MNWILDNYIEGYTLTPCNKRVARQLEKATGEESILFQTDWDFPSLARNLGWRGKETGDATRDINRATAYLDRRAGYVIRSQSAEEYLNLYL